MWALAFVAAVGGLVWQHRAVFFLSWTDEQIHFYVARRIAQGAVLYRDIDSARPPLTLFPIAALIKLGFSPLWAGRALVLLFQLGTAGLLFWGGNRLVSRRSGALAALLALTSPETFDRIHYSGIHLPALTASAAVLFYSMERPLWAGLLVGLSAAADQHGLAIGGMVGLLTVIRRPRDASRFVVGLLAVTVPVFGGALALGGRDLWKDLVAVHLLHFRLGQGANVQLWELLTPWLYEHIYLLLGIALAAGLLAFKRSQNDAAAMRPAPSTTVRVLLLIAGAHVLVVLAMAEAAFLYLVVVMPLLYLLAGIGFDAALAWRQSRSALPPARARGTSQVMLAGVAVTAALTVGGWSAARADRERLDNRPYSFWPYVLHAQVALAQRMDVAGRVARATPIPPGGTIFGDPMIASAVALENGARVSGELADLNPNWIEAGAIARDDVVRRIERDRVAAVVTPPWFLVQDPYFRAYLLACYGRPTSFEAPADGPGSGLPDIAVFPRTDAAYPCRPTQP